MEKQTTYQQIIQQVSNEVNLPEEVVDKTYKAFWLFIKTSIEKLPLKDDISRDDLDSMKISFNIPSLGKLACDKDRFDRLKNYFNNIKYD